jgi:hypothetical protein
VAEAQLHGSIITSRSPLPSHHCCMQITARIAVSPHYNGCLALPSGNGLALTIGRTLNKQFDWSAIDKRWDEILLAYGPELILLPIRVKIQTTKYDVASSWIVALSSSGSILS